MGFGVLVYFFEGIFFCDDGFDKRGTGISKIYFKEYFMYDVRYVYNDLKIRCLFNIFNDLSVVLFCNC